jgi:hypothetical protein
MIPEELRVRLQSFICEHKVENCNDEDCMLRAAEVWVSEMESRGYPHDELILLGLAYQAYLARERVAKMKLGAYETAISAFVAKQASTDPADVLKLIR